MTKQEILELLIKESKWSDNVCYDTFLHEPYVKNKGKPYIVSLNLTAVGIVELLIRAENLFDIEFDDSIKFKTVGNVVDYISESLNSE